MSLPVLGRGRHCSCHRRRMGLACDPANGEALSRILAIKGREAAKGMLLMAHRRMRLKMY